MFSSFVNKMVNIVGSEDVSDDPKILEEYSKDISFVRPVKPTCIIRPKNVEEVQEIIKTANKEFTPLVPVSSPGGPRFYGDTIPLLSGVIVDLSKMNKVLRIDRRNRVVHIQPGVTFHQLSLELKKYGLKPFTPLLPRQTKSVLTSYLEKNPILTPRHHWDTLDPLSCLEVVLGTGDVLRTGSTAGPGTIEDLISAGLGLSSPMGPGPADYSRIIQGAQGTMGIVTWATCYCRLMPQIQHPYFIASEKIEKLIEFMYMLLRRRLGEELFLLNNFSLANIIADKPEDIKDVSSNLPTWIVFINIAGYEKRAEERVAYQEEDIKEIAKQYGLELLNAVAGINAFELLRKLEEPPERYWKLKFKSACQDIFFITTLDKTQNFVDYMYKTVSLHKYPPTELGVYVQPIVQGTSCHCEFNLMYNLEDLVEKETVRKLYLHVSEELANLGAFYSRPYGVWADIAFRRDAETTALLRKVKQIFDPNGILNPGKLCF